MPDKPKSGGGNSEAVRQRYAMATGKGIPTQQHPAKAPSSPPSPKP